MPLLYWQNKNCVALLRHLHVYKTRPCVSGTDVASTLRDTLATHNKTDAE
jgi:hypothetical protein